MTVDDLLMGRWRGPGERQALVERLIASERARRIAEMKVRALEDPSSPDHGITALTARIAELEGIVAKLNATIADLQRRRAG